MVRKIKLRKKTRTKVVKVIKIQKEKKLTPKQIGDILRGRKKRTIEKTRR